MMGIVGIPAALATSVPRLREIIDRNTCRRLATSSPLYHFNSTYPIEVQLSFD
jgi:hypothetical protein